MKVLLSGELTDVDLVILTGGQNLVKAGNCNPIENFLITGLSQFLDRSNFNPEGTTNLPENTTPYSILTGGAVDLSRNQFYCKTINDDTYLVIPIDDYLGTLGCTLWSSGIQVGQVSEIGIDVTHIVLKSGEVNINSLIDIHAYSSNPHNFKNSITKSLVENSRILKVQGNFHFDMRGGGVKYMNSYLALYDEPSIVYEYGHRYNEGDSTSIFGVEYLSLKDNNTGNYPVNSPYWTLK